LDEQLGETLENPVAHDNFDHTTPLLPILSFTTPFGIA